MENKIIKKQMEDQDSQKNGIQKKNKIAINFAKGGSIGIGVGVILVGSALLVNAFHKKKPPQKPTTNKNHETTLSSPLIQQHLISDETETKKAINGSGDSRDICAHKLFEDGNHNFEDNHGKDDLKFDDQEITSCSKDSEDQTMEGNDSVVETEQLPSLQIITNSITHQPTVSSTEDINGISIQLPRQHDTIETTEVDQGTEENHQIDEHEENYCTISQETSEEEEEADTGFEVNRGLIDDDQENDNNGDTVKHGQDNDDMLRLESIEDLEIIEIPEATHENDSNSIAEIFESENDEKVCSHSDRSMNIIKEEEINGTSEADEGDEVLITSPIPTHEGTESKGESQTETLLPEEKTAQLDDAQITEDQESVQIDVQDTKNGLLTTGDDGVSDKFELVEEPNTKMQLVTLEFDEKEAQFDAQINSAPEAVEVKDKTQLDAQTKEAEVDSRIEQTSKLIECQVMKPEAPRFEEKEAQLNAAGDVNEDKEAENIAVINATEESIEEKEKDGNISSTLDYESIEPVIGKIIDHDPLVQSTKETQLIYQESEDLSQDHLVTQAVIVDNVAEISEGLPKLQENEEHVTPRETEKEVHYKNSEDGIITSKILESVNNEKGISNMNFLKKYEKMSFLKRQRGPIVIGTLLWPLFYYYFGLPFLKICLIAFLVIILSEINGF